MERAISLKLGALWYLPSRSKSSSQGKGEEEEEIGRGDGELVERRTTERERARDPSKQEKEPFSWMRASKPKQGGLGLAPLDQLSLRPLAESAMLSAASTSTEFHIRGGFPKRALGTRHIFGCCQGI